MARLLIAGYGFLGEALKGQFEWDGWDVDVLSRHGGDGCVACDLSDPEAVNRLTGDYNLIIHCAATRGGDASVYHSIYNVGCRNLLRRFPEARLIFTSSTSVYAQGDHSEVNESSPAVPSTATSQVLRDTEDFVLASGGVVVRLSALCGPGRCYTRKSFLDGSARLDAGGERVLNFVHRADAAAAYLILANRWCDVRGRVWNVSAVSASQMDCFQKLVSLHGRAMPSVAEPGELKRRRGASSKKVMSDQIRNLGWKPQFSHFLAISENEPVRK